MISAISIKDRLKKQAINHRGTSFDDIAGFENGFTDDETRLMRWNSFVKKKKALVKLGFEETVQLLKILLSPSWML